MKNIGNKYKILIIVLIIVLSLTLLNFTIKDRSLTPPEKIIRDIFLTVEKIIYKPFQAIENIFKNDYIELKQIQEEYLLQKQLIEEQKNTINELKELNGITYTLEDYISISATVIKRNIDTFYQTLILDKGENDGIKEGMAVVTNGGLIGLINTTSYKTSTVKLLTSSFRLSVKIKTNDKEVYGILKEYRDGFYIMEGISENTVIEQNMEVFTTGLGHEIPSGIKIGTVLKEEKDHFDLNRTIYIIPSITNEMHYVKILKRNIS